MKMLSIAALILSCSLCQGQWLPKAEQVRLKALWPRELEQPPGLKFYKRANVSQSLVISNSRESNITFWLTEDQRWVNVDAKGNTNPNRIFPWRVSGGMDNMTGWESYTGIALPEGKRIKAYWGKVEAGASRPLPQALWSFPVGTVFVDLLLNDGRAFEIRKRERYSTKWSYSTAWRDHDNMPKGYVGAGKKCIECHALAGGNQGYGIRLRGADETFSFPVLVEQSGARAEFDGQLFNQGLAEGVK